MSWVEEWYAAEVLRYCIASVNGRDGRSLAARRHVIDADVASHDRMCFM